MNMPLQLFICTILGISTGQPVTHQDEQDVPLNQLPKVILSAVKKRYPKAELVEASKEIEAGKITEYEVTVKVADKSIAVTLNPQGVITQLDIEITAKELPKPVATALTKKYPKATFKSYEQVINVKNGKEVTDHFEIVLTTANKKTLEIEIDPSGKVTNEEESTD